MIGDEQICHGIWVNLPINQWTKCKDTLASCYGQFIIIKTTTGGPQGSSRLSLSTLMAPNLTQCYPKALYNKYTVGNLTTHTQPTHSTFIADLPCL